MICAYCGATVRRDEATWALPPWPNTWNTQNSLPFHPEHAPTAARRPVPQALSGCTCGGIGDTGSHRRGCAWSAAS